MADAGYMVKEDGVARVYIGCLYLVISASLTIVNKKMFSFSGFDQVTLLITVQQLGAIASTLVLHYLGAIRLQSIERPHRSFAAVVLNLSPTS